MQKYEIVYRFLNSPEGIKFFNDHLGLPPEKIILKNQLKDVALTKEVALQLVLFYKAKQKLPLHTQKKCLFSSRSLEQCSSEPLAEYKSKLIHHKKILNLCGGLGVDDRFFALNHNQIISLDIDLELIELAKINDHCFELNNIERIHNSAENFLENNQQKFDLIYADPDRRPSLKRIFTLADSQPNIPNLWPTLTQMATQILIKCSPMIDISSLFNSLAGINTIWCISHKNELKEVLAGYGFEPCIFAVDLNDQKTIEFKGSKEDTHLMPEIMDDLTPIKFLFEPSVSLLKSNLSGYYSKSNNLKALHPHSFLYFNDEIVPNLQGRSFRVIEQFQGSANKLNEITKKLKIEKANITCRNTAFSVDEIRKKSGLKEGGDDYFFFCKNIKNQHIGFHCKKLTQ